MAAESSLHAQVREAVCTAVTSACQQLVPATTAIVLTGSLARGEGTLGCDGSRINVTGDAEFVVVVDKTRDLPDGELVASAQRDVLARLAEQGIECPLHLAFVHPEFFRKLKPQMFAYELRANGKVIWGNASVLGLMAEFSPRDIPLEDAWWTLNNRLIEQFAFVAAVGEGKVLPEELQYRTIKLFLDMGSSLLLFVDWYAPTYAARAENLLRLSPDRLPSPLPFELSEFVRRVADCTEWKLSGQWPQFDTRFWRDANRYGVLLWKWESLRLMNRSTQLDNKEVWQALAQRQSMRVKLRSWAFVVRRERWAGRREWVRWAKLAGRASARYLIYRAAIELVTSLPDFLDGNSSASHPSTERLSAAMAGLPLALSPGTGWDWKRMAAQIVWNYEQFLVETRA